MQLKEKEQIRSTLYFYAFTISVRIGASTVRERTPLTENRELLNFIFVGYPEILFLLIHFHVQVSEILQ